jgi:excisionase family DNA binding protein
MARNSRRSSKASGESIRPAVLTVNDLASFLRVHRSTIYKLVKQGNLPAFKVGADWRFHSEAIDRWRLQQDRASN